MFSSRHLSNFYALFAGRALLTLPSHVVTLFLPIFIFELANDTVQAPLAFYLVGHVLYAVFLPLGAQYLNRRGYKRSMRHATVWNTVHYLSLLALSGGILTGNAVWLGVASSVLALSLFRLMFWLPYHVEVAAFTKKRNRGRSISLILSMITVAGVLGPVLGGVLIDTVGYNVAFGLVALLSLLAMIPFAMLPPQNETFSWGYTETWRMLVAPKYRSLTLAMFANGAENAVGIVVWPIFIYLLLDGNYLAVGAVSSVIVAATIALQMLAGARIDAARNRGDMLHVGSVLSAMGWIAKIFVVSAFHIFVAGVYHSFARIFTNTPVDTMYYDVAADSGHYIDELTVVRELAIQLGKAATLACAILMSFVLAIQWIFLIAALAALLLNSLYSQHAVHRA